MCSIQMFKKYISILLTPKYGKHIVNITSIELFTMEMPNIDSNALPFLDVEVSITKTNKFLTKVYRKPTNTNVIMNHCAIAPVKWKKSLLQLLLLRAKKLSPTLEGFEEGLKTSRQYSN